MSTQHPASEIPSDKSPTPYGVRIHIVDHDAAIRETQRRLLENDQHLSVVGEVASGEEALNFLELAKVDVVTTDLLLPGMSGIETITQIKAQFPAVKVVVLSAYGGDLMERSVQAGADGYVLKPYASDTMVERILSIAKN
jgi:DNA-binding NarL/FixJ family response regulator